MNGGLYSPLVVTDDSSTLSSSHALERTRVIASDGVTHLRYRVVRS
jgi:hypothetical protein